MTSTVSLTYDSSGNLTSDGTKDYAYDFKNRLVQVKQSGGGPIVAQYLWEATDRRVRKVTPAATTRYLYDGLQCVEDRDGAGVVQRQYVWGPELDNLLQERTASATLFAHENAIGSIAALSDVFGAVVERYRYDPFGKTTIALGGATGNEYRFHGARFDPETGMYWMRARHYHPGLGRFVQRDPMASWADQEHLGNGLAIAANDAVDSRDSTGLSPDDDDRPPLPPPPPNAQETPEIKDLRKKLEELDRRVVESNAQIARIRQRQASLRATIAWSAAMVLAGSPYGLAYVVQGGVAAVALAQVQAQLQAALQSAAALAGQYASVLGQLVEAINQVNPAFPPNLPPLGPRPPLPPVPPLPRPADDFPPDRPPR